QPWERSDCWRNKLLVVGLAVAPLALLNWRAQAYLADFRVLIQVLLWTFVLAAICSSGFWIENTRSVARGLRWSVMSQLALFVLVAVLIATSCPLAFGPAGHELFTRFFMGGLIYCGALLWLGRRFWKDKGLKLGGALVILLLLSLLAQLLA